MTNIVYIKPKDGTCQDCGEVRELRPYGPGGKWVCFSCGMKDPAEAERQFNRLTGNAEIIVIDTRPEPPDTQLL